MSTPDDPTAADRARRARGLRTGFVFLGVCAVVTVLEMWSMMSLGRPNSTFSNVAVPALVKAPPATRP